MHLSDVAVAAALILLGAALVSSAAWCYWLAIILVLVGLLASWWED